MLHLSDQNQAAQQKIRTRFAPSPTGFVHLGNIRSALYPWAFARHTQGDFILRIEDTDIERSSQEAVDVIIDSMQWLGLDIDQGPIFQTHRLERYQATLELLLQKGFAYPCYMQADELDALREAQLANKEKSKYNNFWRPEVGKELPLAPDVKPVYRFKNPLNGSVRWVDAVKGEIIIDNQELDDFIIARADGMPTYNFCVVVDDLDMQITHIIRGDDHVNNTPKQINLIQAIIEAQGGVFNNGCLPTYAHLPTVLNEQGEKMSKRHGAIGVLDYQKQGYLPEALINYLARLGWSHGDDEIISKAQLIEWFDLNHLGTSAAQHNPEKLAWLNAHYIKSADAEHLKAYLMPLMQADQKIYLAQTNINEVLQTYQERSHTLLELIAHLDQIYQVPNYSENTISEIAKITDAQKSLLVDLEGSLSKLSANDWQRETIQALIKEKLAEHGLKMPQLGVPLRLILVNHTQTPSLDVLVYLVGQKALSDRIHKAFS
jgi:glutamyl-tRNA synthetase